MCLFEDAEDILVGGEGAEEERRGYVWGYEVASGGILDAVATKLGYKVHAHPDIGNQTHLRFDGIATV